MQRWLESYSYDVVVSSLLARPQDVWVCWNCNGREDVSLVRDLSLGGLFLLTRWRRVIGTPMKVDFLVREGQVTCARSAHKHFFLGKLPRELWARETWELGTSISIGCLGKLRTKGILDGLIARLLPKE